MLKAFLLVAKTSLQTFECFSKACSLNFLPHDGHSSRLVVSYNEIWLKLLVESCMILDLLLIAEGIWSSILLGFATYGIKAFW